MSNINKMGQVTFLFFVALILCLTSCSATNRAVVSNSANLAEYNYATMTNVMGYSGSAALMDIEVRVYDALSATRLQVVGDGEITSLSETQKQQLLIVRFSASQSDEKSVVSINFVDYMTGRPVASCKGSYAWGWGKNHDMKVALDKAFDQMKKLF